MKITSIRTRLITREDTRLKAVASVVFDDSIVIHDIKLLDGDNGLFIAMPSKKIPTSEGAIFKDIAHPINSEAREYLTKEMIASYEEALKEAAKAETEKKEE